MLSLFVCSCLALQHVVARCTIGKFNRHPFYAQCTTIAVPHNKL